MNQQKSRILCAAAGIIILIFDAQTALPAAREGIELCIKSLIPSLFPFFVLSGLLTGNLTGFPSRWFSILEKWFHIPAGSGALVTIGFLSGYPVGAGNVCTALRNKQLSRNQAQRMASFCNNAGPAFLFGMVSQQFSHPRYVWLLWAIQIAGSFVLARISYLDDHPEGLCISSNSVTPVQAMNQAMHSIAAVCGWVILFKILLEYLRVWVLSMLPIPAEVAVTGLVELSNGCVALHKIQPEGIRFLVASMMLSYGGCCVCLQTCSICYELSPKEYIRDKLIQCAVCTSLAILLQPAFPAEQRPAIASPLLFIPTTILCALIFSRKKRKKAVAMQRHLMYNQGNA